MLFSSGSDFSSILEIDNLKRGNSHKLNVHNPWPIANPPDLENWQNVDQISALINLKFKEHVRLDNCAAIEKMRDIVSKSKPKNTTFQYNLPTFNNEY